MYLAKSYKDKIAAGGAELTAQEITNMNHIIINNYTNAGLSVLFLVVVYGIIFYGIRVGMKAHKNHLHIKSPFNHAELPKGTRQLKGRPTLCIHNVGHLHWRG